MHENKFSKKKNVLLQKNNKRFHHQRVCTIIWVSEKEGNNLGT